MLKHGESGKRSRYGICAVIRSLGGGGAERVLTSMLNYWAERGRNVTVITTTDRKHHAYPLHENVRCLTLPPVATPGVLDDCPWNIPLLREAISASCCSVVISFMEKSNIAAILAVSGLPVRLIISERIDPRTQAGYSDYKRSLIRRLYPLADALVVQTSTVKREWADTFMPRGKTRVINNAVTLDLRDTLPDWLPDKFICCMGRLMVNKGFNGLIDVFRQVKQAFPEYKLVILGEGDDRENLNWQIKACGLKDSVLLPGFIRSPHATLAKSSLFILPSRCEGYPNALIEAMALGLPCVSFDCPSGPSEIIEHNVSGMLLPNQDYDLLQKTIVTLLADKAKREFLGCRAREAIARLCNPGVIMRQWDSLAETLLENEETVADSRCISAAC